MIHSLCIFVIFRIIEAIEEKSILILKRNARPPSACGDADGGGVSGCGVKRHDVIRKPGRHHCLFCEWR